ncbi:hypothetical protein HPP92_024281 [Vanilla planifolia]|uniref:VQ domain-containing protein n=1 Tax=Vanilla planifolia TaxID=51239 RepID=A0A835UBB4_VANPL|nr:hypothetical protein HPP92_024609 [Vanilla planifolia]KAG0456493.1 hypothetical protein HPP92_024281 [Vanilla planifolia]
MSCGREREAKVVVIETRFVQTDTLRFKSVVQQLTGRDAGELPSAAVDEDMLAEGGQWQQRGPTSAPSVGAGRDDDCYDEMSIEEFCSLWE